MSCGKYGTLILQVAAGDYPQPGEVDLRRIEQPGSYANADRDTAVYAASSAVRYLKGKSSQDPLSSYVGQRNRYGGQHIWARGYWVATDGSMADKIWKRSFEKQKASNPDVDFNAVKSAA